jgi:hydrogenase maturation protease
VRAIADAVLYEGYVLWPYRRSALKNQKRWTFGGVYPRAHAERHPDDPWVMRTECLLETGGTPLVDVSVRFLQVVRRRLRDGEAFVDELTVDGERHLAWDESVEREMSVPVGGSVPIAIPSGEIEEPPAVRSWEALEGSVATRADRIADGLYRLTVEVSNTTAWDGKDREEAMRRTFCSTHAVLRAREGAFASLTDPPERLREAAAACSNRHTWPVLAGEPGSHDTLLSSPIILEDHPRIAPESPGDFFDGGEIDQMLVLNILSLTDEERAEMRDSDPRTRELLERTESLGEDELRALHGAIREFGMAR